MQRPDYEALRRWPGFDWAASGTQDALRALAGISFGEFNLKPAACIEVYRKGRPLHRELFGPDVRLPGPATPSVSYGHISGLGAELKFPDDGEVAHVHLYDSLQAGIAALKQPVDFATAGWMPFYRDFQRRMQEAFPDEPVGFSYKAEGPITTAWELRGEGFFTDLYDDPPAAREFLRLVTASVLEYHAFLARLGGQPAVNPKGAGLCDDIASLLAPDLWPDFVLPAWEQYYTGLTTGTRGAHVENLRPAHLPFLETIGLSSYDPSVSPYLTPPLIASGCRVPFTWRLASFHYRDLSGADIENFVYHTARDGARGVFTNTEGCLCNPEAAAKMQVFIRAGRQAKALVDGGADRAAVAGLFRPEGAVPFWNGWSGFKG